MGFAKLGNQVSIIVSVVKQLHIYKTNNLLCIRLLLKLYVSMIVI